LERPASARYRAHTPAVEAGGQKRDGLCVLARTI
jgi:hypothetical protein